MEKLEHDQKRVSSRLMKSSLIGPSRMQSLFKSLYAHNDWANSKVLRLCEGLSDQQLDAPREMGFGSLRATLFHILAAEQVWLERWESAPWRPFPTDPQGMSLQDIKVTLQDVAARRLAWIDESVDWNQVIRFQDSHKTLYEFPLHDLLLHVYQHGVHHRAQALNYLRHFARTIPGGIDYIFYRLAQGSTKQSAEAVEQASQYGLGVNECMGQVVQWRPQTVMRMFEYGDWAFRQVAEQSRKLDDRRLDQPFDMGMGSLRKNLLHCLDAETWWVLNWTHEEPQPFPQSPADTPVEAILQTWQDNANKRNEFLTGLKEQDAYREIVVSFGGPPFRFQVGESSLQLTMHGTHHRAQIVNMLRHVGAPIGDIDLLYALEHLS